MSSSSWSTEPIVTGEAVAIELRTAGVGSRGVAAALDFLIQLALLFGVVLIVAGTATSMNAATVATVFLVLYVIVLLGYPVLFETLWRGRTLGKAALGLRVLRDDGGPIRFRHALVRGLVGVVVDKPGLSFGLFALVPMLLSGRNKRLGDLAAGTVVVQERVPATQLAPPPMPPALASWAMTLDLTGVDDRLALEMRHFLSRATQLTDAAREGYASRLAGELSRRVGPPPPGVPIWAYLSAVLAERRRRALAAAAAPVVATAAPHLGSLPRTPTAPAPPAAPPAPPEPGGFAPPA